MDGTYPVSLEVDYVQTRSRWKTFLRYLLAIPWLLWGALIGIGLLVVTLIAWFAILVTGRYPVGLYAFAQRGLRYSTRVGGFTTLLTDAWPPFDLDEHREYPVRTVFAPQPERQSRLTVFFRGILIIPVYIVFYVYGIVANVVVLISWLVGVFGGSQPESLQRFLVGYSGYSVRVQAYYLLLRDEYPPLFQFGSTSRLDPEAGQVDVA
jgi:Domain of unknown function (DUF4389)